MKKIFNLAILTALLLQFAQPVNAQRWARIYDSPVTVYNFTETVNTAPEIVNIFYNTQGEHFRDPLAPRFILTDREGRWGLGIGGYLMGPVDIQKSRLRIILSYATCCPVKSGYFSRVALKSNPIQSTTSDACSNNCG